METVVGSNRAFLVSLETAVAEEGVAEAVAQVEQEEAPKSSRKRVGKGAPKKGRPAAVWVAAAAAAVAAGAAVTYVATRPEEARIVPAPSPSTGPVVPPPELVTAANLRHRAAVACDEGRSDDCLWLLDQAAAQDPAGDTTPEVQALRKKATATEVKPK